MSSLPVVLVHGGAHGAWCWDRTVGHLDAPVLAVDLPPKAVRGGPDRHADVPELATLTIGDLADSVLADLDAAGLDRVVLVGHSMAGVTIPEVARRAPARIAHLVFVSCTVPAEGATILTSSSAASARTREAAAAPPDPETLVRDLFGTDLDEDAIRFVLDHLGGEVHRVMTEPVSRVGLPASIPKTWIRLLRDAAVTRAEQDVFIANLEASPGGRVDVVDLDTGHHAMLSRPVELAGLLDRIAAAAR